MKTRVETIRLGGLGVFADFFNDAKELATTHNCVVKFTFNGVPIVIVKHSLYEDAWNEYSTKKY